MDSNKAKKKMKRKEYFLINKCVENKEHINVNTFRYKQKEVKEEEEVNTK